MAKLTPVLLHDLLATGYRFVTPATLRTLIESIEQYG
jgi:hypothetical protein